MAGAVMRVNLKGPFPTMKHAIPLMAEGGGGAVVNLSATAVFLASADASYLTGAVLPADGYLAG
jgi:NAD(P)-dependent dehydrogenase (short-subunit alcohol dehydrogenase family)